MKKLLTLFTAAMILSFDIMAGDAVVSWDAPTTYEDGTPLLPSEIVEYKLYYGTTSGGPYTFSTVVPATSTTYTVSGLTKGVWYFVATVKATNSLESVYSNEVAKTILSTSKPSKPRLR